MKLCCLPITRPPSVPGYMSCHKISPGAISVPMQEPAVQRTFSPLPEPGFTTSKALPGNEAAFIPVDQAQRMSAKEMNILFMSSSFSYAGYSVGNSALNLELNFVLPSRFVGTFQMIPDPESAGTVGKTVLYLALDDIFGRAGGIA